MYILTHTEIHTNDNRNIIHQDEKKIVKKREDLLHISNSLSTVELELQPLQIKLVQIPPGPHLFSPSLQSPPSLPDGIAALTENK